MIYPAHLHTLLRPITPEGQQDEIQHTCRAMVALRDDSTSSLRYADPDNNLECLYVSPMGEFQMHTHTTLFNATVDAHQGRVELHYELFLSDSLAAQNELEVWWERQM